MFKICSYDFDKQSNFEKMLTNLGSVFSKFALLVKIIITCFENCLKRYHNKLKLSLL